MTDHDSPVTILDTDKAWDLLAGQRLGRLVVQSASGVDIFPVNYALDGESIVFRTAEGTKLSALVSHGAVIFEIDSWDEQSGYSVIAKGEGAPVDAPDEIARLEALRLRPWVPTVKTTWVRIGVTQISGRRFRFGPDPVDKYR